MNTVKIYKNINGNDCTVHQMIRDEPEWAATKIQVGEDALATVKEINDWDIDQYMEHGSFVLPHKLRDLILNVIIKKDDHLWR